MRTLSPHLLAAVSETPMLALFFLRLRAENGVLAFKPFGFRRGLGKIGPDRPVEGWVQESCVLRSGVAASRIRSGRRLLQNPRSLSAGGVKTTVKRGWQSRRPAANAAGYQLSPSDGSDGGGGNEKDNPPIGT